MSLKTFFEKLFKAIAKFFKGLAPELKEAIHWGVVITDKIKKIAVGPGLDILTDLIPGEWDDKLKDKLRLYLPEIFVKLRLVQSWEGKKAEDILKEAIATLQEMAKEDQKPFLHDLSILIAKVYSDGKLTWEDGAYILEWYYRQEYKPKLQAAGS